MSLFISQAHAAAEGAPEAGGFQFIFMTVVVILILVKVMLIIALQTTA